jgi:hypothetical protein
MKSVLNYGRARVISEEGVAGSFAESRALPERHKARRRLEQPAKQAAKNNRSNNREFSMNAFLDAGLKPGRWFEPDCAAARFYSPEQDKQAFGAVGLLTLCSLREEQVSEQTEADYSLSAVVSEAVCWERVAAGHC